MDIQRISDELEMGRDEVCGWLGRSLTLMASATETSACGGDYHHVMVRTETGWRSKQLREENLWFDNPPSAQRRAELQEKADWT